MQFASAARVHFVVPKTVMHTLNGTRRSGLAVAALKCKVGIVEEYCRPLAVLQRAMLVSHLTPRAASKTVMGGRRCRGGAQLAPEPGCSALVVRAGAALQGLWCLDVDIDLKAIAVRPSPGQARRLEPSPHRATACRVPRGRRRHGCYSTILTSDSDISARDFGVQAHQNLFGFGRVRPLLCFLGLRFFKGRLRVLELDVQIVAFVAEAAAAAAGEQQRGEGQCGEFPGARGALLRGGGPAAGAGCESLLTRYPYASALMR